MRIIDEAVMQEIFNFPTHTGADDSLFLTHLEEELQILHRITDGDRTLKDHFAALIDFCLTIETNMLQNKYLSPAHILAIRKGKSAKDMPRIGKDTTLHPFNKTAQEYIDILHLAEEFDTTTNRVSSGLRVNLHGVITTYLRLIRQALDPHGSFMRGLLNTNALGRQDYAFETVYPILIKIYGALEGALTTNS